MKTDFGTVLSLIVIFAVLAVIAAAVVVRLIMVLIWMTSPVIRFIRWLRIGVYCVVWKRYRVVTSRVPLEGPEEWVVPLVRPYVEEFGTFSFLCGSPADLLKVHCSSSGWYTFNIEMPEPAYNRLIASAVDGLVWPAWIGGAIKPIGEHSLLVATFEVRVQLMKPQPMEIFWDRVRQEQAAIVAEWAGVRDAGERTQITDLRDPHTGGLQGIRVSIPWPEEWKEKLGDAFTSAEVRRVGKLHLWSEVHRLAAAEVRR